MTAPARQPISRASKELREQILYYCRESVRCGLNFNTQGNISVRLPEHDAIVITPSDIRYDALNPEDMIVVSYDGTVLEGSQLDASLLASTESSGSPGPLPGTPRSHRDRAHRVHVRQRARGPGPAHRPGPAQHGPLRQGPGAGHAVRVLHECLVR